MNILFMYSKMFNPTMGGIERVTDLLCREFKRRGHSITYLNNDPDSGGNDYIQPRYIFSPTIEPAMMQKHKGI